MKKAVWGLLFAAAVAASLGFGADLQAIFWGGEPLSHKLAIFWGGEPLSHKLAIFWGGEPLSPTIG
jgi:hypothetical protein